MDCIIIGRILALLTLMGLITSIIYLAKQLNQEIKLRTIEYITGQFDKLDLKGSSKEMREVGKEKILDYVTSNPDAAQKLLEYVYAFNRIGAGIKKKILREDIVFEIWTPKWFEGHWDRFESFLVAETKRRGEEASKAYVYFHWLAKKKCPEVEKQYPEYKFHWQTVQSSPK